MAVRLERLSGHVLLAVLFSRRATNEGEITTSRVSQLATQRPFDGWSVQGAVVELESYALVLSVAQKHEEMQDEPVEVEAEVAGDEHMAPGPDVQSPLPDRAEDGQPGQVDEPEVRGGVRIPGSHEEVRTGENETPEPLAFGRKLSLLRQAWNESFPASQYEYQRLTVDGARKLLAGDRDAEWVAGVIRGAPVQAAKPIQWPLAYVLKMLDGMEKNKPPEESGEGGTGGGRDGGGVIITDELRQLTEMMRKRYEKPENVG